MALSFSLSSVPTIDVHINRRKRRKYETTMSFEYWWNRIFTILVDFKLWFFFLYKKHEYYYAHRLLWKYMQPFYRRLPLKSNNSRTKFEDFDEDWIQFFCTNMHTWILPEYSKYLFDLCCDLKSIAQSCTNLKRIQLVFCQNFSDTGIPWNLSHIE